MRHLDLFSGIGGFAFATAQVWGTEYKNVGFCDNDKYCQELLKIRFPGSVIYNDIRKLKGKDFKHVDLLTGGFPCQPFSQAGKRRGTEDNRHLWPEMLRIITEIKPHWIIGENVVGILTMAQQQGETDMESETDNEGKADGSDTAAGIIWSILNDLECIGCAVQTFVIPACSVNAPHRRDRVWIVAYKGRIINNSDTRRYGEQESEIQARRNCSIDASGKTNTNAQGERRGSRTIGQQEQQTPGRQEIPRWYDTRNGNQWDEKWIKVATELCRMDDGLPAEMDGFKLSKACHRINRLKALGNSIVPQVAIEIMKAIKEFDNEEMDT